MQDIYNKLKRWMICNIREGVVCLHGTPSLIDKGIILLRYFTNKQICVREFNLEIVGVKEEENSEHVKSFKFERQNSGVNEMKERTMSRFTYMKTTNFSHKDD